MPVEIIYSAPPPWWLFAAALGGGAFAIYVIWKIVWRGGLIANAWRWVSALHLIGAILLALLCLIVVAGRVLPPSVHVALTTENVNCAGWRAPAAWRDVTSMSLETRPRRSGMRHTLVARLSDPAGSERRCRLDHAEIEATELYELIQAKWAARR